MTMTMRSHVASLWRRLHVACGLVAGCAYVQVSADKMEVTVAKDPPRTPTEEMFRLREFTFRRKLQDAQARTRRCAMQRATAAQRAVFAPTVPVRVSSVACGVPRRGSLSASRALSEFAASEKGTLPVATDSATGRHPTPCRSPSSADLPAAFSFSQGTTVLRSSHLPRELVGHERGEYRQLVQSCLARARPLCHLTRARSHTHLPTRACGTLDGLA